MLVVSKPELQNRFRKLAVKVEFSKPMHCHQVGGAGFMGSRGSAQTGKGTPAEREHRAGGPLATAPEASTPKDRLLVPQDEAPLSL